MEGARDITLASHLIGDMTGSTIDDPLSETYKKLGCSITPLDKSSNDYQMIVKYLENTYEPVKVGEIVRFQLLHCVFNVTIRISSSVHFQ